MKKGGKMKRLLGALLALSVLISVFSLEASAKGFADVKSTDPGLDAINYVSDNGLIVGTDSTHFSPDSAVTRGQIVAILYRKAGSPSYEDESGFLDVPATSYYYHAINWAAENKIASGTSSTKFEPNKSVTREQAISFIHRFAANQNQYLPAPSSYSITTYTDYSNISTYARDAVKWGMYWQLLSAAGQKILPTAVMSRRNVAIALTNYGVSLERIIYGKDNFSFKNYSSRFHSDSYYITTSYQNLLETKVREKYADFPEIQNTVISQIRETLKIPAPGHCFGMCSAMALDKSGKIAFNENFGLKAKTIYEMHLSSQTVAESVLTYYQLAQYMPVFIGSGTTVPNLKRNIINAANAIINGKKMSVVRYWWNSRGDVYGHTILVTSVSDDGYTYTFTGYDPDKGSMNSIQITRDGLLNNSYNLVDISAISNYSVYDFLDVDGYKNNGAITTYSHTLSDPDTSITSTHLRNYENYATINALLSGEFTIANSQGEYIHWTGHEFEGTMTVYNSYLTAEGKNSVSRVVLEIPESELLTFSTTAKHRNTWFSVANRDSYSRVKGLTIGESAELGISGSIRLNGDSLEFETAYSSGKENAATQVLSGKGCGVVTIEGSDTQIKASGLIGDYIVTTVDKTGNEEQQEFFSANSDTVSEIIIGNG